MKNKRYLLTLGVLACVLSGCKSDAKVATVPADTPIFNTNKVFYNTLLDENAACHFALGNSYIDYNLKEGAKIDDEMNISNTHVDFVFGTTDMTITATLEDGTTTNIFEKGVWVVN